MTGRGFVIGDTISTQCGTSVSEKRVPVLCHPTVSPHSRCRSSIDAWQWCLLSHLIWITKGVKCIPKKRSRPRWLTRKETAGVSRVVAKVTPGERFTVPTTTRNVVAASSVSRVCGVRRRIPATTQSTSGASSTTARHAGSKSVRRAKARS
jgi:hypothetical protein